MFYNFLAQVPFPGSISELFAQFTGAASDAHPVIQFLKYAFAGGVATVVHVSVFFIFGLAVFPCVKDSDILVRILRVKPRAVEESARARNAVLSNIIAFVAANAVCYTLNRIFVFEPGRHSILVEIILFYTVSGIAVVFGTAAMHKLISKFGMQTSFAFAANLVFSLALNYVLRKYMIFNG